MEMEMEFFNTFETQYGTHHPFFYACKFTEALKIATGESKFLFLYIHSTENADSFTESFCKTTLCSELVVQFLDSNFVSWGTIENKGEGFDLVTSLKVETLPFCAVLAPFSGDNFVVLQQIEGPVSPQELVEILQRTLDEHDSSFNAARSEQERTRREDRQLRQEQDAAYLESLRKDQEKELRQKIIEEKTTQKQMGSLTKGNTKSKETNLTNSSQRIGSSTKIMIRLPNGERRPHTFHPTDKIWSIYNYIDSLNIPEMGNYKIITNFPKRIFGFEQLDMSLKDAGFHPSATLYLENFT